MNGTATPPVTHPIDNAIESFVRDQVHWYDLRLCKRQSRTSRQI